MRPAALRLVIDRGPRPDVPKPPSAPRARKSLRVAWDDFADAVRKGVAALLWIAAAPFKLVAMVLDLGVAITVGLARFFMRVLLALFGLTVLGLFLYGGYIVFLQRHVHHLH